MECQHPADILCIHLPRGFWEGGEVDEERLRLLPSASVLRVDSPVPLVHANPAILDSLSDESLTSLAFPADSLISTAAVEEYADTNSVAPRVRLYRAALLSLFHYFDCQQAMQRSEQVLLRCREWCSAWLWLPYAVRHMMKALEDDCIERLGRDTKVGERVGKQKCLDSLGQLPPAIIARVMAAMSRNLPRNLK